MGCVGEMEEERSTCHSPHVLLFPFMSKGHTIPLLQFARLLLRRNASVTLITTPANLSFVSRSLRDTAASVISLPLPDDIPGIPVGVESTDRLPSMSLFFEFAVATARMQPHFERVLRTVPRVTFMVTDGFLWWTLPSASEFGIPRLVYYGMSCYAGAVSREAALSGILSGAQSDDEPVQLTRFPWIRVSKMKFPPEFRKSDPTSLADEFHRNILWSAASSSGILVNSFYELEPVFVDYMNRESNVKSYCAGPFCAAEEIWECEGGKAKWIEWLERKGKKGRRVLYVAFGSQAEMSEEQMKEIARGLEESEVDFLWVIRKEEWKLPEGFEERVEEEGRGMVVRAWVNQREILKQESVKGFMSHCGWNSVLEGIWEGVPILAWPMMAEQPLNGMMVEEEIKVGFRVVGADGGGGIVKGEVVRKMVKELMEGDKGRAARKRAEELAHMAKKAVEEGGSSWCTLESLLARTWVNEKPSSRP